MQNIQDEVLLDWTAALAREASPALSTEEREQLVQIIRLCAESQSAAADQALYNIARANWTAEDQCEWLAGYLHVMAARPEHRAFACLEALMMNPVTAEIGDVRRAYHGLLNLMAAGARPARRSPDGFPDTVQRAAEHALLDEFLEACNPANWHQSPSLPTIGDPMTMLRSALLSTAADVDRLTLAIEERAAWLKRHRRRFAADTALFWRVELKKLASEAHDSLHEAERISQRAGL